MSSTGGSWRVAARLARREIKRHPWRHLLVTTMILVPVLGAFVAFSAIATWQDTAERDTAFRYPSTRMITIDAAPTDDPTESVQTILEDLGLPESTRAELSWSSADWLVTDQARPDGRGPKLAGTEIAEARPGSVRSSGFVVDDGRLPRTDDEIFLTRPIADAGNWKIGDTVTSARGSRSFEVVGIGRFGRRTSKRVAVVTDQPESYWTRGLANRTWVAVGDGDSADSNARRELTVWAPSIDSAEALRAGPFYGPRAESLDTRVGASIVLAAATLCAVVAIVASAAFAISSRRQLRTIGLLSTVGTDPTTIRRSMVIQGALPGVIAGTAAVLVGVGVAATANHLELFEQVSQVYGSRIVLSGWGAIVAVGLGVASGIAAAWQPARTASRIPTLSALAGRRPLGPVPSGVPAAGAALWVAGAGMLLLAFGSYDRASIGESLGVIDYAQPFLILGGVACLALGCVGLAPAAVALLEPLAGRFRGTWRMGLRGLARHRMQSAATVAAIAVVLAVPVGLLTTRNGLDDRQQVERCCDEVVTSTIASANGPASTGLPAPLLRKDPGNVQTIFNGSLRSATLPDRIEEVRNILGPTSTAIRSVPLVDQDGAWRRVATIDEGAADRTLEPWAARAIASGQAIRFRGPKRPVTFTAAGESASFETVGSPEGRPTGFDGLAADYLVGTRALKGVGDARPADALMVVRPAPLTDAEHNELSRLPSAAQWGDAAASWDAEPTLQEVRAALAGAQDSPEPADDIEIFLIDDSEALANGEPAAVERNRANERWERPLSVSVAASMLLALLVLTITLSLRAVDGEVDRRAALAAGVAPASLRRLRSFEGVVLALLGAILAVPLGWIPVTAARFGADGAEGPGADGLISWISLPGWPVIPIVLAPALLAGILWTVVPAAAAAVRNVRGRGSADDLLPRF